MRSISLLFIFISFGAFSQNLFINPDFEMHSACPTNLGQFFLADGWSTPNTGTPDYFNDCSVSYDFGTEFNKKGGQIAHSGHAYIGIQFKNLHSNYFYEYIETKLKNPLDAGQLYCMSLFVSLGNSDCALKELGAVASQNVIRTNDPSRIDLPYIPLTGPGVLSDSTAWTCIRGTYKAKGGEQFITIGYFSEQNTFLRLQMDPKLDSTFFSAYYFIDDVTFSPVKTPADCFCIK